ncbi:hypothetical protein BYT27DRAFT_7252757 [Phlegmacium glaucopus]|nr:hypothetical protein BYT27DRAFT_7252757 [Phlegmacium glaucopus]
MTPGLAQLAFTLQDSFQQTFQVLINLKRTVLTTSQAQECRASLAKIEECLVDCLFSSPYTSLFIYFLQEFLEQTLQQMCMFRHFRWSLNYENMAEWCNQFPEHMHHIALVKQIHCEYQRLHKLVDELLTSVSLSLVGSESQSDKEEEGDESSDNQAAPPKEMATPVESEAPVVVIKPQPLPKPCPVMNVNIRKKQFSPGASQDPLGALGCPKALRASKHSEHLVLLSGQGSFHQIFPQSSRASQGVLSQPRRP